MTMISEILERIGDMFSDGGNGFDHEGHNDIVNGVQHSGIDLSMYGTDEIKDALKIAMNTETMDGHSSSVGHDIPFNGSPDVEARNLEKSKLLSKLNINRITTSRLYTDKLWGGLDLGSAKEVENAINSARDHGSISHSEYSDLMEQLRKARHA